MLLVLGFLLLTYLQQARSQALATISNVVGSQTKQYRGLSFNRKTCSLAHLVEMVDTTDLKSVPILGHRFKSDSEHLIHRLINLDTKVDVACLCSSKMSNAMHLLVLIKDQPFKDQYRQ